MALRGCGEFIGWTVIVAASFMTLNSSISRWIFGSVKVPGIRLEALHLEAIDHDVRGWIMVTDGGC